jgi:predicted PurR-regulated permease PerM
MKLQIIDLDIGKSQKIHFFQSGGGLQLFGFLGIMPGPVMLSMALVLLEAAKESPLGNVGPTQ